MERETILDKIISTQSLPDCEASDILWTTLVKVVNIAIGNNESAPEHDHQKLESIVEKLSEDEMRRLLKNQSVDSLVFLDPPLETILTDPEGSTDKVSTMRAIGTLRSSRDSDPKDAFVNLVKVLKIICAQGFKEGSVHFNKEILLLTRKILYLLCILTVSKLP